MSVNIKQWLESASDELKQVGIASYRLDAEILLAHTIKKPRTYLHAHPEEELNERDIEIANARIALRLDRTPIAYIIGHKEFYDRRFKVTTATLIPRPESEDMISMAKKLINDDELLHKNSRVVDVGTGTGCLGITIKLEVPTIAVTLIDISKQALNIAEQNAKALQADVHLMSSDLLGDYPLQPDLILANLPYVDPTWETSPELIHEPQLALFAKDSGLELIKKLIKQSTKSLSKNGVLILEADPRQHRQIISFSLVSGFSLLEQQNFCLALKRD